MDGASDPVRRFESRIRTLARRYLRPDRAEAVVRRVLDRLEGTVGERGGPDPSRLGPFVYEIALRTITEESSRETSDPLDLPFDRIEREASSRALRALTEDEREVLRLAFHRGLCPSEIAEVLDLSVTDVLERKRRALERFAEAYPED